MNLFGKIGIHARLLIAAACLITASTAALGYFGAGMIHRFVSLRFDERINYMAEHLALNAELGILIDERSLLVGLARSTLGENDIADVAIIGAGGEVLVRETRVLQGPFIVSEKKVVMRQLEPEDRLMQEGRPVPGEGGDADAGSEEIGRVQITYTRNGIERLTRAVTGSFVAVSMILALISCVIFFVISRSLVRPVVALARVAGKVSRGDTSVRGEPGSVPETRHLAHAFNEMLDSIEAGRKALINAHEKLTRQEALAEVGKFSLMVAHEVKNPLAIIKCSLEMLKKDLEIPDDNMLMNYTEEEIVRLNDLIESFLVFSRPTKPKLVPCDLNHVAGQVVVGFQLQYDSGTLEITHSIPGEPCMAEADADLLSRCLSNIVRNACDATLTDEDGGGLTEGEKSPSAERKRGRVHISVIVDETAWTVGVKDRGTGIDSENLNKIFEPFFTTKATGTGLGLAFADQVMKAHGGSITAENHESGGAMFRIRIPLAPWKKEKDGIANG